jgi:hypothetical protein
MQADLGDCLSQRTSRHRRGRWRRLVKRRSSRRVKIRLVGHLIFGLADTEEFRMAAAPIGVGLVPLAGPLRNQIFVPQLHDEATA